MTTSSKKHHFVPKAMLKNFASGRKHTQIFVYDKRRQVSYSSSLVDAGSENFFNSFEIGGRTVSFESAFQGCDDALARLNGTIVRARSLSALTRQDRATLSYLAAIQFLRVKLIRKFFVDLPKQLRGLLAGRGQAIPGALGEQLTGVDDNAARVMCLKELREADGLARHFVEKDWSLLATSDADPFWTSDNPIVLRNLFPYGSNGLASEGIEICWPMSSELLLMFRCPTVANRVEQVAPSVAAMLRAANAGNAHAEHVEHYNSLQVLQSDRFVYASTKEFGVARRALKDHPELAEGDRPVVVLESGADRARNPRMPMGKWLVAFGARSHHMCRVESVSRTDTGFLLEIHPSEGATLDAVMSDPPHGRIVVYEDQVSTLMMRDVILVRSGETPTRVVVQARDPGIRSMMQTHE